MGQVVSLGAQRQFEKQCDLEMDFLRRAVFEGDATNLRVLFWADHDPGLHM